MTPTFVADVMLGKLARWLRLLGFDVAYANDAEDDALLAEARATGRRLLTRDVALARRAGAAGFLVRSLDPPAQLEEVVGGLGLLVDPARATSRCALCNVPVRPASAREIAGVAPAGVRARHAAFRRCPSCGRAYWAGTHHARILARARALASRRGPHVQV